LEQRVEQKIRSKKTNEFMNRLHVAVPAPRDNKERIPIVPESVLKKQMEIEKSKENEDEDEDFENGNDDEDSRPFWLRGINKDEWKKKYMLKDEEWKFDPIPEFIDGKNIADFIDPDILKRLDELEKEEEERMLNMGSAMELDEDDDEDGYGSLVEEDLEKVKKIKIKKLMATKTSQDKRGTYSGAPIPKKMEKKKRFGFHGSCFKR